MFLIDIALVLGFGFLFRLVLHSHYQHKINDMKKSYHEFNNSIEERLKGMSETERNELLSAMPKDTQGFFNDILNGNSHFHSAEQFQFVQQQIDSLQFMQDTQFDDFSKWAMDESLKAVTPFDHGGYVQGPGFNPSDTMAHEMNQDMNNSMNMHSSHDNFGGF